MSPFRTVLLFVLAVVISLSVLPGMKVSWAPVEAGHSLTVYFGVSGADPSTTEQQATAALENRLSQIGGIKNITSVSGYNGGNITLSFDKGSDMAMKRFEAAMRIRQLYPELPPGVSYPVVNGGDAGSLFTNALLIYSVDGPAQPFRVSEEVESILKKRLAEIPGISRLTVSGTPGLVVRLSYHLAQMQAYGVTPDDMLAAVNQHYAIAYPGVIHDPAAGTELFLRIIPSAGTDIASLERLEVSPFRGQTTPVRLKDIATVYIAPSEPDSYFRINGKNSVNLSIYPVKGANNILLARQVKEAVGRAKDLLPKGYEVHLAYDDTAFLVKELDKTWTRMALSGGILLCFIFIGYRNWRYLLTLWAGLAVNLALTLLGCGFSGYRSICIPWPA